MSKIVVLLTIFIGFLFCSRPAYASNVVINEFLADGSPEWVEFYNPNPDAEFIKSYWIDDDTDFDSDSGNSTKTPLSALNTASATFPYIELSTFLNDGGDNVVLFDNSGNILDQYT